MWKILEFMKKDNLKFDPNYSAKPNVRFSLRLTEKLKDELENYSYECDLSMNTLILKCIEYALENSGKNMKI